MQLVVEILLPRHGVEITVETVNRDEFATRLYGTQNTNGEFAGRKFGGVNLLYRNRAAFDCFFQLEPQRFARRSITLRVSSNVNTIERSP